jgi:hypothetical protein
MSLFPSPNRINEVYSPVFASLADKNKVEFVDIFGALGGQDLNHPEWFLDDGIHPNEAGYDVVAKAVRSSLIGPISGEIRRALSAWSVVVLVLMAAYWNV